MRLGFAAWWPCIALASAQAATAANAQSVLSPGAQTLFASVGYVDSGLLDETASPVRFAGGGVKLSLGWSRTFAPIAIVATLEGSSHSLAPLDGSGETNERFTEGVFSTELLRRVGGSSAGPSSLLAGVEITASATINEHTYPAAEPFTADYLLAAASIGPAATWTHAILGGRLSADLGIPLLALVDHPYSDIRDQHTPLSFRFVSAESYRGLRGGVSFTNAVSRTLGVVYAYRVGIVRFDDTQPVREVEQSISVGLVARVGRAAR